MNGPFHFLSEAPATMPVSSRLSDLMFILFFNVLFLIILSAVLISRKRSDAELDMEGRDGQSDSSGSEPEEGNQFFEDSFQGLEEVRRPMLVKR